MGFKVVITESATEDVSELVRYVARDNPRAAAKLGYAILARFQVLEKYPYFGRVVPERNEAVWRELIYKSWRLIYFVDEKRKTIYAARVWHGARGEPKMPGTLRPE